MTVAQRIAHVMDRFYDRSRSPAAAGVADALPTGSIDDLKGHKYCVLVSYKRDGTAMPSPLWFGVADGKMYAEVALDSWKVKRIRRNPNVRVAPSTSRGKPTGPPFAGTARVLPDEDGPAANRAIQANYGITRRIYESLLGNRVAAAYLEVTPVQAA